MERPEWGTLRRKACETFGTQPSEQLEEQVVTVFRRHPNLVADAINSVAAGYHSGNMRSPWAVLAWRVKKDAERAERADTIQADRTDEPKQVRETKTRIRNSIYLHDDLNVARDEIEASLGPHTDMVDEMLELWRRRRIQVGWSC
jgi:hypothetical protein